MRHFWQEDREEEDEHAQQDSAELAELLEQRDRMQEEYVRAEMEQRKRQLEVEAIVC